MQGGEELCDITSGVPLRVNSKAKRPLPPLQNVKDAFDEIDQKTAIGMAFHIVNNRHKVSSSRAASI